jgi:glucose-1-phosphate thymidylyltransferase
VDIILPVAGLGTRLRPQTWSKPKPLVALAGRPMLSHVIDRVMPLQPERIIFITGFLGDQIESWANANVSVPVEFVRSSSFPTCCSRPTSVDWPRRLPTW